MRPGVVLRREGSVATVLWVVVILGILAVSSVMMSTGLGRRDHQQALRENAREVARVAAEEAALLINNGRVNVAIDEALGRTDAVPVESPVLDATNVEVMGVDASTPPRVTVRAAVISPDQLPKKPPLEQLREIQEEIESRGYDPATYQRLQEFWQRVEDEGLGGDDGLDGRFWAMAGQVKVESWGPRGKEEVRDPATGEVTEEARPDKKIDELRAVWELFYDHDGTGLASGVGGRRPAPGASALGAAWPEAMRAVGREAASRMESCGSNPNLAMSHLVGDLKTGEPIASGTEVDITSAFMKSRELGGNATYLLEITAAMAYGGRASGLGMGGEVEYTTYRLFQKSEWEKAVQRMTESLVSSLLGLGVSPSTLGAVFPPDPSQDGRDEVVPGSTVRYDPRKVVADPIFEELPSTLGARMYPYTLANVH